MDINNIKFITASEAIEQELKTLGLWEFPCGPGSWREPQPISKFPSKKQKEKYKEVKSLVPEKVDCSEIERIKLLAEKEKTEALQELVSSPFSPWHIDYTWSNESNELREIAVKTPWLLNADFVLSYLKTVRICDKNVTVVDKKILELKNLEELTLSANYITSVNSLNLPKKLKILELCANQISDVSSLCLRPPPLQHLGLSKNIISFLGECFRGPYWPNLLSLDLSHNDLCGLVNVISTLSTLPKLRHLILNGNPLSLGLAYRGLTIDTIKHLAVFDDKHISVDEKLSCKGISGVKEVIKDEAHFQIQIPYVKGIPCPDEIKNKDQTLDMFVERLYFVQFEFPEDRKSVNRRATGGDELSLKDGEEDVEKCNSEQMMTTATDSNFKKLLLSQISQPDTNGGDLVSQSDKMQSEIISVPFQSKAPEVNIVIEETPASIEDNQGVQNDAELTFEESPPVTVIKTTPLPWAQEQTLNCLMDFKRKDLLALRDFFRKGMQMSVVEQLIIGSQEVQSAVSKEERAGKGKGNKLKTKEKLLEEKTKSGQKNLKKDSKKKKETEFVKLDPVFSTVASFNIPLELFLDGEYEYKNVFTELNLPPAIAIPSNEDDTNYNKNREKKREAAGQQDRNTSARKSPGKDKGKKKETPDNPMETSPKGLEMEVMMKLKHWLTAKDVGRI